jgi:hypothetical protein
MERKTIKTLQWIAGGVSVLAFLSQFEPVKSTVKTIYHNMRHKISKIPKPIFSTEI